MGVIGKALVFTAKAAGTAVIGTVGVASAIIATSASVASPEAGAAFGGLKDGCFSAVKKIWDPNASGEDVLKDLSSTSENFKADAAAAEEALKKYTLEKRKEVVNNPELLRKALRDNGKNPALADNPEFVSALKKKWGV